MKLITEDDIFRHCRIDRGIEDEYLIDLGETAEEMVLRYLGRTADDLSAEFGQIPMGVKRACLLVVASLYKNREMDVVQSSKLNQLFIPLIIRYRKL